MPSFYYRQAGEYDTREGFSRDLYINNLGYFKNIPKNIRVERPHGREDWHILYVASGEIIANGKSLKNGHFCIYSPEENQSYTYLASQKNTLYYWVHFTGKDAESITRELFLSNGRCGFCSAQSDAAALFEMITNKLSHTKEESKYALSLFRSLLALLCEPSEIKYPFSRAIRALEDFGKSVSIEEIAELYGISTAHFIRSFKNSYGATPAKYRIKKQILHAKNLLRETEIPISDVAEQCGIADQFYFSRLFKSYTGMTPSEFRKNF